MSNELTKIMEASLNKIESIDREILYLKESRDEYLYKSKSSVGLSTKLLYLKEYKILNDQYREAVLYRDDIIDSVKISTFDLMSAI